MMIAEDSTDFQGVTKPIEFGGLGFDYKWDLGWMNDTLKYYAKDPIYKKWEHNKLTFSMAYFFSENFLLPLSHDRLWPRLRLSLIGTHRFLLGLQALRSGLDNVKKRKESIDND